MYTIISLGLVILGLVLFFAPEYIVPYIVPISTTESPEGKVSKYTENKNLNFIIEYHQVLGFVCIMLSLYFYMENTSYDNNYTDINSVSNSGSQSTTHSVINSGTHSGTHSGPHSANS